MMMLLHGLRLAADLAFYYAFAGYFSASSGGAPTILSLILPSVCFGLASRFEGRQPMQTLCGLASLAGLLLPGTMADKLVYLPMAAYTIWMAARGDFSLSWEQQVDEFQWFWKLYPAFALVLGVAWNHSAILYGSNTLITTIIPMEYTDCGRVGLVAGLVDALIYVGSALAGTLTGWLHETTGAWTSVYLIWAAVAIVGAAGSILSARGAKKLSK